MAYEVPAVRLINEDVEMKCRGYVHVSNTIEYFAFISRPFRG